MYKIAVIYSDELEITDAAKELIQKKAYHVEVAAGVLNNGVGLAMKYEAEGYQLIISHGIVGSLIKKAVKIPVIMVEYSNMDILKTVYKAKQMGKKIGFFQYSQFQSYDFELIREILDMPEDKLQIYHFQNEEELREKITDAYDAVDVVVSTSAYMLETAGQQGMKTMMVHLSREAFCNALKQAEVVLDTLCREQDLLKYLNSLAKEAFAGLILLNQEENVIFINAPACNLLKIDARKVMGKNISEVLKGLTVLKGISYQQDIFQVSCNGIDINMKKMILYHAGEMIGYAINLESAKSIKQQKQGLSARYIFADMIGNSPALKKVITKAKSYGKTDLTVLVTGESGTGKEILVNSIHNISPRRQEPFVAVNCATLPQSLLESELFGYEEGSFTGARKGGKPGLFEVAQKGTLFLDEISEMNLSAQVQLLRVLQEKMVRRIGGSKNIPVDVRIIAASNADLHKRAKEGQFREDLFYRLNVLNLCIPPLRERKEDIPLLMEYFLEKYLEENNNLKIPEQFMKKLQSYYWPGNVRELENLAEKYAILSHDNENTPMLEELFFDLSQHDTPAQLTDEQTITVELGTLKDMEMQIIELLYGRMDKTSLSKLLGISRSNLWSKLKELEKGPDTD